MIWFRELEDLDKWWCDETVVGFKNGGGLFIGFKV
jgi:hypothetical protein